MAYAQNFWYLAAESKALGDRPLARRLLGQDLVLYRGPNGEAIALHDRCPHRGAALSPGRVVQGQIECPYHGWCFGSGGCCSYIPSLPPGKPIPSGTHAQSFPIQEGQGYVWLWMGARAPAPEEQPFVISHMNDANWGHARLVGELPADAGACVENFIDTTHTGYVHGGLFRKAASHGATNRVRAVADGVIVDIEEEQSSPGLLGRLLLGPEAPMHQDRFFLPATVQVHYRFGPTREVVGWQFCTPIDEHKTLVHVHVAYRLGWLNPLLKPIVPRLGRYILNQDVAILGTLRAGDRQASTPADLANLWIRQAMLRAENGEGPSPDRESTVAFRL